MREASVPAPDNRNTSPQEKNATPPRRPSAYDNPMQNSPTPNVTAPAKTPDGAQQNDTDSSADSEAQPKKEKRRKNREEQGNKKERSTGERSAEESQEDDGAAN
jgi:hypothetical protein